MRSLHEPTKFARRVAEKLEIFSSRTAKPLEKFKVPVMYTSEHDPKFSDVTEVIVTDHSDSEPNAMNLPKERVITREWTGVDVERTYHVEPEDEGQEFL
eukprot:9310591-Pyramimonas_sp.AAC.1